METINVKDFTSSSYGIFEDGQFITSGNNFEKMKKQAIEIANEGISTVTIGTLAFGGTDEEPTVQQGTAIMGFLKINDTVYITNEL